MLLRSNEFAITKPSALDSFFSDPAVLQLLAHPFTAFSPPNQHTKSAFETKTSAINVTPSSTTRYYIKEVKEDALWLSKEAKIDEVSALRVVIVECQDRQRAQLLGTLSSQEAANIEEAAGTSRASIALYQRYTDSEAAGDDFSSLDSRRLRILRTYLSERRNVSQCLKIIAEGHLYPDVNGPGNAKAKGVAEHTSWLRGLSDRVWEKMDGQEKWILEALSVIRIDAENTQRGSGWFQDNEGREDMEAIEIEWVNNQIIEISYAMELIFQFVDSNSSPSSSTIVVAWLETMEQYGFFDHFETVSSALITHHLRPNFH